MARGWESKSVESQQSESVTPQPSKTLTGEELERARKRASVELSRTRVMTELETATSDVHRTALQNALQFLDAELIRLG
jgi:hypothetical protein